MKLHPFDKVVANAKKYIDAGVVVHQQFNCSHCGAKQTMAEENTFFMKGICEECSRETDIKATGTNFMARFMNRG
jgi:hypothetical protein